MVKIIGTKFVINPFKKKRDYAWQSYYNNIHWKNLLQLFSYSLKKTIYLGNTYYTHIQHDILLLGFRAIFTPVFIVLEI